MKKIRFREEFLTRILLLAFLIFYSILAYYSEGSYGGADDITHYRFSRYAFLFPEFFLNHWAKPFYTLIMAPFAQFGFIGVRLLNVILGCLTAYLSYLIVRQLSLKNSIIVIFFILFSTLYPALMLSGMTEILFSLLLVLAIYLFLKKKYTLAAIVLSFLPLVRTEGVVLLVVFILPFILKKKYLPIAFFFTGFILYSIIGGFYYDDFLWLITQMPYGDATDIYGTGSLFHFVIHSKNIFGILFSAFAACGLLLVVYHFIWKKSNAYYKNNEVVFLIMLPALAYYGAHSFSWYLGIGASVGLIRVMAGVIPLFAIIALITYNFIVEKLKVSTNINLIFSILLIGFLVHSCFTLNTFPVPLREKNKTIKLASEWIKKSEFSNRKIYYYDPYFFFFLDKNPFDKNLMEEFIPDREKPGNKMKKGEILIWDAHFSANEGHLPLARVKESKLLHEIKVFKPENSFTVLGGYDYQIVLFEKVAE